MCLVEAMRLDGREGMVLGNAFVDMIVALSSESESRVIIRSYV